MKNDRPPSAPEQPQARDDPLPAVRPVCGTAGRLLKKIKGPMAAEINTPSAEKEL